MEVYLIYRKWGRSTTPRWVLESRAYHHRTSIPFRTEAAAREFADGIGWVIVEIVNYQP